MEDGDNTPQQKESSEKREEEPKMEEQPSASTAAPSSRGVSGFPLSAISELQKAATVAAEELSRSSIRGTDLRPLADFLAFLNSTGDASDALDSLHNNFKDPSDLSVLLGGLSHVFISIRSNHFEQIRAVVPIVVKVVKRSLCLEDATKKKEPLDQMLYRLVENAEAVRSVSKNLENEEKKKLQGFLSVYLLQIVGIMMSVGLSLENYTHRMASLFHYCGVSYADQRTPFLDEMFKILTVVDEEDYSSFSSDVYLGASLLVIWAIKDDRFATLIGFKLADGSISTVGMTRVERWQVIGWFNHLLSSNDFPLIYQTHAIQFLEDICVWSIYTEYTSDPNPNCIPFLPGFLRTIEALLNFLSSSSEDLRKQHSEQLLSILESIPRSARVEILKDEIEKRRFPHMIAEFLQLVRTTLEREDIEKETLRQNEDWQKYTCWTPIVLEIVDSVLKCMPAVESSVLPDQASELQHALDIYLTVLTTESKGNTNFTGALSRDNLQKACDEWLRPLRERVDAYVSSLAVAFSSDAHGLTKSTIGILLVCSRTVKDALSPPQSSPSHTTQPQ